MNNGIVGLDAYFKPQPDSGQYCGLFVY